MLFQKLVRRVYYTVPVRWRLAIRRMLIRVVNIFSKEEAGMPPRHLVFTGRGDFKRSGEELMGILVDKGEIDPVSQVLDIGSGIGRVAIPLTNYLSEEGGYEGFDIMQEGVKWCQENISAKHSNFTFTQVALKNDLYNATKNDAEEFVFPYADGRFDLSFAFSLFTHLLPAETQNYFSNVRRVLKPTGRLIFTAFTYEDSTAEDELVGSEDFNFPHVYEHYRLMDNQVKSANVAYAFDGLKSMLESAQLELLEFHPGFWRTGTKTDQLSFQDVIVARVKSS